MSPHAPFPSCSIQAASGNEASRRRTADCAKGATMLEFVLVFPIVAVIVLCILDFSRYLVIRGLLNTAANRAVSRAAVVPNLDIDCVNLPPNMTITQCRQARLDALRTVLDTAKQLPLQTLVARQSGEGSTRFVTGDQTAPAIEVVLKKPADVGGSDVRAFYPTGVVTAPATTFPDVAYPPGTPLRSHFEQYPIEVVLRADMDSFIPYVRRWSVEGRKAGFREVPNQSSFPTRLDCVGNIVPPNGTPATNCPCTINPNDPTVIQGNNGCVCVRSGMTGQSNPDGELTHCECPSNRVFDPVQQRCVRCPSNQTATNGACVCTLQCTGGSANSACTACDCPTGTSSSNGVCCPPGQFGQNGACACPNGQEVSGTSCVCPSGTVESNGHCCPSGLEWNGGGCCPPGEQLSNNLCCPVELTNVGGICCPWGQQNINGVCACPGSTVYNSVTRRCECPGELQDQGGGNCQCPTGQVQSGSTCSCPSGQVETNNRCCPTGTEYSNGGCCPSGTQNSGGVCCPTNTVNVGGLCCPPGQQNISGTCGCPGDTIYNSTQQACRCPSNTVSGPNSSCTACPGGTVSNNYCCPSGQVYNNGGCCPSNMRYDNGICCPSGSRNDNGICCPNGTSNVNGQCLCPGELVYGSNGCRCPGTLVQSGDECGCPNNQVENGNNCECPLGTEIDNSGYCSTTEF